MMRRVAVTLVTLTAMMFLLPVAAQAQLKVHCKPSVGFAQVDPVVAHGSITPSEHLHEFFGNETLLTLPNPQTATYQQLTGQRTACGEPGDSAVYWAPALLVNGKPMAAPRFISYYRSFDDQDYGQAQPLPADLRMVTGKYDWGCGQFSNITQQSSMPDCSTATGKEIYLTVHYNFPSCWDGRMNDHSLAGDTADYAPTGVTNHLAFYVKGKSKTCPTGFPIQLPQLRETISWGDGTAAFWKGLSPRLSSDMPGMPAGSSGHADFWNTWQEDRLTGLIQTCVNNKTSTNCDLS